MNPQTSHHGFASNQGGFVLIFALLVLVTLTFLGFMAVRTAVTENTLSGNERVQRQTFSLADGGTEVAVKMLQENMDCPTGFPASLLSTGTRAIQFPVSAVLANHRAARDYMSPPPLAARNSLPPAYDANAAPNPEIVRQFCIGGEGIVDAAADNGCGPANTGAPHTNILYNPNPDGAGATHNTGESGNATGAAPGRGRDHSAGGTLTNVDIFSQHVAYSGGGATNRESIIRMRWAQKSDSVNNCRW